MSNKKNTNGKCRICGQIKILSYEHIPPKSTFNKTTRHISIPFDDYIKNEDLTKGKLKGKILQGGIGFYSLCKDCNNFLGSNYVKPYQNWVQFGMEAITRFKVNHFNLVAYEQEPLRIIKQIIAMFLAMNDDWYLEEYPDLVAFIKDPKENNLPNKYQIFTYLNNEGEYRYIKHNLAFTIEYGIINITELTFPPFGYVLTFDLDKDILPLTNITYFKNYKHGQIVDLDISLNKLPTFIPISPLDYRTKEKIEKDKNTIKE
jgi:hypothetical protein